METSHKLGISAAQSYSHVQPPLSVEFGSACHFLLLGFAVQYVCVVVFFKLC